LAGLRAKSAETSRVVESFLAEPAAPRAKESLRRHLHALSASAQLFGFEKLGQHIAAHLALLDAQTGDNIDTYRWRSLPVRYLDLVRDSGVSVDEPSTGAFAKIQIPQPAPEQLEDQPVSEPAPLPRLDRPASEPTVDLSLDGELESVI